MTLSRYCLIEATAYHSAVDEDGSFALLAAVNVWVDVLPSDQVHSVLPLQSLGLVQRF